MPTIDVHRRIVAGVAMHGRVPPPPDMIDDLVAEVWDCQFHCPLPPGEVTTQVLTNDQRVAAGEPPIFTVTFVEDGLTPMDVDEYAERSRIIDDPDRMFYPVEVEA